MLSGSELWLLRLMADRGLALLDATTLLMVIEERAELRVAAASGAGTPRLRVMPVEGSALGALYLAGQPVALDRPRGQEAAWLHELGLEARAALVEPLQHGGPRRRPRDRAARWRRLPRPRPPGAGRVRGERRAASGGRALGRDRASALRHGGARARAHALGARDPRRDRAGSGRAAPETGRRARPPRRGGALRGGRRGARGPRRGDRRAAPSDHRAAPRGARRPRPGARARSARPPRARDRRPGGAHGDRARARRRAARRGARRARSTASCRRP